MRSRLINKPVYHINSNKTETYKPTIMMKMDCECFPFSGLTRLTSLDDLYRNYSTDSDSPTYNIAKNFLSTGKANILGINRQTSNEIRTSLAVYEFDDNIIPIYPSYKTLLDKDETTSRYLFEFDYSTIFAKHRYFKIYGQNNTEYICVLLNTNKLTFEQTQLFNVNNNLLMYKLFGLSDLTVKYIIVPYSKDDTLKDISSRIFKNLLDNNIKFYYKETIDSFTIEFVIKNNLTEEYITNCEFKRTYSSTSYIQTLDASLSEDPDKWYAYRLRLEDNKSFYFKTYYTKQYSVLFCVVYKTGNNDQMSNIDSTDEFLQAKEARETFGLDVSFYTKIEVIVVEPDDDDINLHNKLVEALSKYGVLFEFESYYDSGYGENCNFLTIYSNRMHEPLQTNLPQDINYKKSYDLDYLANYKNMLFTAYSKLRSSISNIKISINRFNLRYDVSILNTFGTDTLDVEYFSDTDLQELENKINTYSKYIYISIKGEYLPIGDYTLKLFNTNLDYEDRDYLNVIDQITGQMLNEYKVDFIYNIDNSIDYIERYNKLIKENNYKTILFTDVVNTLETVTKYDFSNVIECSDNLTENIEDDNLLADYYNYYDLYLIYKDLIFLYNCRNIPKKLTTSKYNIYTQIKVNGTAKTFKEIRELINKQYRIYYRDKTFIPSFKQILIIEESKVGNKWSITPIDDYFVYTNKDVTIKITNSVQATDLLYSYGVDVEGYEIPFWGPEANDVAPEVEVIVNSIDTLNKDYNGIVLTEHSNSYYDSSYILLMNIFDGKYEFDENNELYLSKIDNFDNKILELKNIYKDNQNKHGIQLNRWFDNEYYYSMLNPCGTLQKSITPLYDYVPAILQINHAIDLIGRESVNIDTLDDASKVLLTAIDDVEKIVPINDKLQITAFDKINRSISMIFSITFNKSTKLQYDFDITINI